MTNQATAQYREELKQAIANMRELKSKMVANANSQTKDNTNWGHVGNITHLNAQLEELIRFMS